TAIILAMLAIFPFLPQAFSPAGDNGFTQLSIELPPGATLDDTLEVAETVRERLVAMPEVTNVFTTVGTQGGGRGFRGGGGGAAVRRASLTIHIDNPDGTRGAQQVFERKATAALADIPGARLQFQGGGGDRLQVTLAGDEPERLAAAAAAVERELRTM